MSHILVVAAHPDDETLGCGGTLLKRKKSGDVLSWLIATNVSTQHGCTPEFFAKRQNEIARVAEMYNFDNVIKLDLPATRLDEIPFVELVKTFSEKFSSLRPHTVLLPNRSDVHSDHRRCFEAAYSSAKNFRCPFITKIMMYEALSETEFSPALSENAFMPNVFIDVTEHMDKKLEIMSVYSGEVMLDNLPRSFSAIRALAAYRGSRVGVNYAEAFMLIFDKS